MMKNALDMLEADEAEALQPVYEPKMTRRRLKEAMEQGNVNMLKNLKHY